MVITDMKKFKVTIKTEKSRFSHVAVGFKTSSEALLNTLSKLQGDIPKYIKVQSI
jgi:hypothetical protein